MSVRSDELKEMVDDAWTATEALDKCDGNIRQIAFERLLDHLLAATESGVLNGKAELPGAAPSDSQPQNSEEPIDGSYATSGQRAEAVARYFDIAVEDAEDLFDLSEIGPGLQVPSKRLPDGRAEAVRKIALLVCGARTALGLETGSGDIRKIVEEYGKYDRNFMPVLGDMPELIVRGKSRSRNRLVRMRVIGMEEARTLAASLTN